MSEHLHYTPIHLVQYWEHAWNAFYGLDSLGKFVPELNWVSEETSQGSSQWVFLIVWAAPQRGCFQSQDTVTTAAFNSVNFQVLLASVQTKHTEAVGWLSNINLLHHPKIRVTVKISYQERESMIRMGITEKEYQLKCSGLFYSEGVKGRGSEIIQNWSFNVCAYMTQARRGKLPYNPAWLSCKNEFSEAF